MPNAPQPLGSKRQRFLVILVGVVIGYVVGRMVEDRYAWENARILTMALGGILAGVIARFSLERFRSPSDFGPRRSR